MLHITNGDCAIQAMSAAGIAPADILPWRDVLHAGPVPAGLPLEELSALRARFLAEDGFGDVDVIRGQFYERDVRLAGSQAEDEVVCWFESDLYDQLQLLQVFDWYAAPAHRPARLSLVQLDRTPDGSFEGLGGVAPERVRALTQARVPVSPAQLDTARAAWAAFRAADPLALEMLWRSGALDRLPCLPAAVQRLLEELPWCGTGLSRTQRNSLECLAGHPLTGHALFRAVQAREARPFMGDAWFWRVLEALATGADAPVARQLSLADAGFERTVLSLTAAGKAILEGRTTWTAPLERWLGGTALRHGGSVWHWDGARQRVVPG